MIHFRYLLTVAGGLLHTAPDMDAHLAQLADAVAQARRARRAQPPLPGGVRPAGGLDVPATPAFVDALEERARCRRRPRTPTLRRIRAAAARRGGWRRWSRTGVGRWLMNDERADLWDEDAEARARVVRRARGAQGAGSTPPRCAATSSRRVATAIQGVWKSAKSAAPQAAASRGRRACTARCTSTRPAAQRLPGTGD